jgi:hypothetical protein
MYKYVHQVSVTLVIELSDDKFYFLLTKLLYVLLSKSVIFEHAKELPYVQYLCPLLTISIWSISNRIYDVCGCS